MTDYYDTELSTLIMAVKSFILRTPVGGGGKWGWFTSLMQKNWNEIKEGHHDIQHNDIQHNDTQYNDIQHYKR